MMQHFFPAFSTRQIRAVFSEFQLFQLTSEKSSCRRHMAFQLFVQILHLSVSLLWPTGSGVL